MIAEALMNATGLSWTIGVYIAIVSLVAVSLIKEPKGVDLHA
jgi:hypothetical protein